MKLKYKISAIIFVLIVIVSVTNYKVLTGAFESLQTKRLESAETLFGKSLAQKIYRQVIERKQEIVVATLFEEMSLRENKLEYLVVNNRDGSLFAHTYLAEIPPLISSLSNTFKKGSSYRIDNLLTTELSAYNIGVPIREGIIQVGTLHVGIGKDVIVDTVSPLKRASEQLIAFAVIITIIGGSTAYLLSLAITRSLTRLQRLAEDISRGNYDVQIDITGTDEVGVLAKSFGKMRDNIKEALQSLEEQNLNLENIVNERTKELAEKNDDLEEQRKNLKIVFSAMDYPLYVINVDHSIAMMNDTAKKTLKDGASLATPCYTVLYGEENSCLERGEVCVVEEVIRTQKPYIVERARRVGQDQRIFEIRAYPIFDHNDDVVQVVEACVDITEKKRDAQEKLQLERELNKAHKLESIGTLAAGVAHEINTPIQFIGDNTTFAEETYADLIDLIENYKDLLVKIQLGEDVNISEAIEKIDEDADLEYIREELPKALAQTAEGVEHVSSIVKAMKDFSHHGSGTEKSFENLNDAIETTVTISKNEWKYVADIDKQLSPNLPSVGCHIGEIKQVLLNFIVNASHAIADKLKTGEDELAMGRITIVSSYDDKAVTIEVRDTGTGIKKSDSNKIFDPFYTTKDVGKGTGQGLSVAYQIIAEKHGGEIWFSSELGEGTGFFFSLPRGKESNE